MVSPLPRLEGVVHGSRGLVVARGTGWEPGARRRKRGHVGQGSWPSSAVDLGSEGSGGGRGAPVGTSARWALEPLPHQERQGPRSGLVTAVARRLPEAGCAVRGGLEPQHLPLHQPGVEATLGQQLLVCALLHHAALVQHHDEVRPLHRAQPVRDDEHRVLLQVAVDGLLDLWKQEGAGSHGRLRRHPLPRPIPAGIPDPPRPMDAQPL